MLNPWKHLSWCACIAKAHQWPLGGAIERDPEPESVSFVFWLQRYFFCSDDMTPAPEIFMPNVVLELLKNARFCGAMLLFPLGELLELPRMSFNGAP